MSFHKSVPFHMIRSLDNLKGTPLSPTLNGTFDFSFLRNGYNSGRSRIGLESLLVIIVSQVSGLKSLVRGIFFP